MSKNNGMDSQDLDKPSHKYNAKKIISFFFFSHSLHLNFLRFILKLDFAEIGNLLWLPLRLRVFAIPQAM